MENEGLEGGEYLHEPDTRHMFVKALGSIESIHSNVVALFFSRVLNSLNVCPPHRLYFTYWFYFYVIMFRLHFY